jgi:hypothetical protein
MGAGPGTTDAHLHDAVDLASGAITTTPGTAPPTTQARSRRLADAGFGADGSIFARPRYRLTAQRPYQKSPEAWLDAFDGTYSAGPGVDQIWWRLQSTLPTEFQATCNGTFLGLAAGPAVLTLRFEVWPFQAATGQVVVDVGAHRTEIAVSAAAARTVDIGFVHDGSDRLVVMVLLRQGIFDFVFRSVSLGSGVIILDPMP